MAPSEALGVKFPDMTSKAPSSPVETTDAPEQRPDHTGVIRGADEAEARSSALTEALARIESLWNVIRANGDTNARLMRERDEARAMIATDDIELQAKDATIDRLWAQLNEATNVPAHYSVEGAAGPCLSCDQPASTHYHLIGGGCMNSEAKP
jgi:hypothetical protein